MGERRRPLWVVRSMTSGMDSTASWSSKGERERSASGSGEGSRSCGMLWWAGMAAVEGASGIVSGSERSELRLGGVL